MTMTSIVVLWLRTGLIWFLATQLFGLYLGITGQFGASSPHAHLGLLGWLSAVGFAVIHALADPEARLAGKARLHWIVHNVGLITHAAALWLVIKLGGMYGIFVGVGGLIIILATLFFIVTMWSRLRVRPQTAPEA